MVARELPEPLKMDHRPLALRAKNKMASVDSSGQWLCDHWRFANARANVPRTLPDMPQSEKQKPSCSKIRQICCTSFYIDVLLYWVYLCDNRFLTEKWFRLNYCSMGLSQPPSGDTVPLTKRCALHKKRDRGATVFSSPSYVHCRLCPHMLCMQRL
jgi:hypothetical protein